MTRDEARYPEDEKQRRGLEELLAVCVEHEALYDHGLREALWDGPGYEPGVTREGDWRVLMEHNAPTIAAYERQVWAEAGALVAERTLERDSGERPGPELNADDPSL